MRGDKTQRQTGKRWESSVVQDVRNTGKMNWGRAVLGRMDWKQKLVKAMAHFELKVEEPETKVFQ